MTSTVGSTEPTAPSERSGRILRFTRAERLVHRATAGLMLLCAAAAACLYFSPLAQLVGRRHLVVVIHEWSGILLPAPFLLGLASSAFRADLRRLNRLARYDKEWLRAVRKGWTSPDRRPAGKFNAGQKIYAGWMAGTVPIMMFTGLLMWFGGLLPVISRTSAIFVHDVTALAITLVVLGHIRMAYLDPQARRGMRTGYVEPAWARRQHSRWVERDR
ncbi:cytochrome b/b6 domain-containing protein [Streptosporangium sp. OZ121]|uniref:cytochrome b/b6 domain-containing protein n=1 Tax=Streptosporangium sp. OZ121 TaxID=3444183 RepID=UPI003F7A5088